MKKIVLGAYILITILLILGLAYTYQNRITAENNAQKIITQIIDKPQLNINGLEFKPNQINTKRGAILTLNNKDLVGYDVIIPEIKKEFRLDANSNNKIMFEDPGIYSIQLKSFPYVKALIIVE